jgi:hypothetical protein
MAVLDLISRIQTYVRCILHEMSIEFFSKSIIHVDIITCVDSQIATCVEPRERFVTKCPLFLSCMRRNCNLLMNLIKLSKKEFHDNLIGRSPIVQCGRKNKGN